MVPHPRLLYDGWGFNTKQMSSRFRIFSITAFAFFAVFSVVMALTRLEFSFAFEDFFPEGDPDLEFFMEFRERFEPDDNFLLVALRREEGAFEEKFLNKVLDFSNKIKRIEFEISSTSKEIDGEQFRIVKDSASNTEKILVRPILSAQSIVNFQYPVKTPFSMMLLPAIHLDEPERYEKDREKILNDERLVNSLVSEDGKTLVVFSKTVNNIQQETAEKLMARINELLEEMNFEEYHILGRANFQTELVSLQIKEFILATVVSGILVLVVMYFIFRRFWGIVISLSSIVLGLVLFVGFLGAWGRELDTMAALYPVIMIIVGTSDVIHIMSKYIDELQKGKGRMEAIRTTMREIGLAILLTSTTTAIGFASLYSSRIPPIKNFGINAAVGVMIAYVTVLLFTTAALSFFKSDKIIKVGKGITFWNDLMNWFYHTTKDYPRRIVAGMAVVLLICAWGLSMVSTNTKIEKILPLRQKITADFQFFEKEFSGFRPFEIAVMTKEGHSVNDFEVVQQMAKLENYLDTFPAVQSVRSITTLYKSINRAYGNDRVEAYKMPQTEARFKEYQELMSRLQGGMAGSNVLVSENGQNARISARVLDVGADSIKRITEAIDTYIARNLDTTLANFRQTGTGVIVDKNSEYMRDSLIQGLGFAILVVSLLMALIYRNAMMVIISLIPNVFPLLLAGAMLGFAGFELEAGTAIIFAVVFGIAVDDTIHLLSKFRLMRGQGLNVDESIRITLLETGKAICLTTVILFFGFLILLFSSNPPSLIVGSLISLTLFAALLSDLFIIPVMLRAWIKDDAHEDTSVERPQSEPAGQEAA